MNILILTNQYPTFDKIKKNKSTFFMHQYTSNWEKMGHNVLVMHVMPVYPKLFNKIIHNISKLKNKSMNILEVYKYDSFFYEVSSFIYDSVNITRIPIKKYFPHGLFLKNDIEKCFNIVNDSIKEKKFEYDIILTDFLNPSLIIGEKLKVRGDKKTKIYSILHETDFEYLNNRFFRTYFINKLKLVDSIGYRSKNQYNVFVDKYYKPNTFFLISSGLPEKYIRNELVPKKKIKTILTVSRLIKRKNIDTIIRALYYLNNNGEEISLEIVGQGPEEDNLKFLIKKMGLEKYCTLNKDLTRNDIIKKMYKSDCFILVSEKETFGMTYIEAMSQGCITIGSKGEGIDSILIDGYNGFLCSPGNSDELIEIISKINNMDLKKVSEISINAYKTAGKMTDEKLSLDLIENLINI